MIEKVVILIRTMSSLEIILLVMLGILTGAVVVVSWQVFFFFRRLRSDLNKVEKILNQVDLVSQRLLLPVADLSVAWRFLTHSGRLFKIIDKLLDKPKNDKNKQR